MPNKPARHKQICITVHVTVLGIDANYEPLTLAAYKYREKHVYPYFLLQGFAVSKLQGPMARRHYVAPAGKKPEIAYLTGVGHGSADFYAGDHGDVIYKVDDYQPDESKGKIVHFLSCQTARELGPNFVDKECRAYFGYDEDFALDIPNQDIFFECDSEIDRAFADGLTAAQVYHRTKKLYDTRIAELLAAGKLYPAAILEFNRNHLRCPSAGGSKFGSPTAKL